MALRALLRGAVLAAKLWPQLALVASAQGTGRITGVLLSAANGEPLPYATVTVGDSGQGRFTNDAGRFALTGLTPGTHKVRARQIGFSPLDTMIAVDSIPVQVVFRLQPLALRLATVPVTARRLRECIVTGIPDAATNPQLAGIFSQLRTNVDRYRLLVDQYPFHYRRVEHEFVRTEGGHDSTKTLDTVSYYSRDRRPYNIGGVVYDEMSIAGGRQQKMYIPTFRDLADPTFQAAHCFSYAGQDHGSIRIDFQPATRIKAPDIEGSVYLDAHRYIVQRAVFRMTKPDAVVPPILGLTATTIFAEIVPLVPVVGSTYTEQPISPVRLRPSGLDPSSRGGGDFRLATRTAIEDDKLLDHTFDGEGLNAVLPPPLPPQPVAVPTPVASAGCRTPPALDTIAVYTYGTLTSRKPLDAHADGIMQSIQHAFRLAPNAVRFPVYRVLQGESTTVATPTGQVGFTVGRDSRITNVHITVMSLSEAVDSALIRAVRSAESAGAPQGDYTFSLSSIAPPQPAHAITLGRIEVPVWHLTQRATLSAGSPPPDLPQGSGTFEFVVDEQGRAIPTTLHVIEESEPRFGTAVARLLPDFLFKPARIGPCAVKQLMHQPFSIHPFAVDSSH